MGALTSMHRKRRLHCSLCGFSRSPSNSTKGKPNVCRRLKHIQFGNPVSDSLPVNFQEEQEGSTETSQKSETFFK